MSDCELGEDEYPYFEWLSGDDTLKEAIAALDALGVVELTVQFTPEGNENPFAAMQVVLVVTTSHSSTHDVRPN